MEARNIRRIAREKLAGNWAAAMGVGLAAALLGASIAGGTVSINVDEDLVYFLPEWVQSLYNFILIPAFILSLAQIIMGGTVQIGYARYLLKQHDQKDRDVGELFSDFDRFGRGFLQMLLRSLYVILWSLLFIIPGIIAGLSYAMTPFIMAEYPELTASEAISASKEMMDGYKTDLFILGLTFFGWQLLCLLTLGIGNLFLRPYMDAAYAAFYNSIKQPLFLRLEDGASDR